MQKIILCLVTAVAIYVATYGDSILAKDRFAAAGISAQDAITTFHKIRTAVLMHDVTALSTLVHYPIKVSIGRKEIQILNEAEFIRNYDAIINLRVICAVLMQKEDDLAINSYGVMIGRGEIWFSGIITDPSHPTTYKMYITSISNSIYSGYRCSSAS